MSGPKRNPDSLNTIGVVVVGICGAVMVYVSITALQAFYMNDTSELQTMQDYGGQDTTAKSHKAEEMRNINEPAMGTPSITIDKAMDLVIKDTKEGHPVVPAVQVGANGQAFKPKATEVPHGGSPELLVTTPPPATTPAAGSGSGSGSGSGISPTPDVAPHTTGSPADKTQPVPGAGGAPAGAGAGSAQRLVPNTGSGGHAR